ncbi:MAG: serine/threonine protein kinase, partial [bacterium]
VNEIDSRTDIFAFGALVYEMATGKKAFPGETQASVIAKILEVEPPPLSSLQPSGTIFPPALDRVVKKCLAKDPERRWQSAGDLHDELVWIKEGGGHLTQEAPAAPRRKIRERLAWGVAALAVAAVIAVVFGFLYSRSAPSTQANTIRFSISPTSETAILGSTLAVSPDGTQVAFTATEGASANLIWVRPLDSPAAHSLQGTEGFSPATLFWSPDSRSIGFVAANKLKTVPVAGGPVQVLADAYPRGGSWSRDGTILFTPSRQGGLAGISASGGASSPVTTADRSRGETSHRWPYFLPDGRHFLYFADTNEPTSMAVYVGSLDSQETRLVLNTAT